MSEYVIHDNTVNLLCDFMVYTMTDIREKTSLHLVLQKLIFTA